MNLGRGDAEQKYSGVSLRCAGCSSCYSRQQIQPILVHMSPIAELEFEQELATKTLKIQSKRYYLDVKENSRGRFMKIAEISADGRRSQVYLALSTAAEFRDHLSAFSAYYASLGPIHPYNAFENDKLKSEMMFKDTRRYYLDLKENDHGRFLRLSQSATKGGSRLRIAIPAQGMIEMRDALTDLLDEFGTNDGGSYPILPEERHLKVDKKNFYFDIGQNKRGVYMRISELTNNYRNAITMPDKGWEAFRDILIDYCEKLKQLPQTDSSGQDSVEEDDALLSLRSNNSSSNSTTIHNNNSVIGSNSSIMSNTINPTNSNTQNNGNNNNNSNNNNKLNTISNNNNNNNKSITLNSSSSSSNNINNTNNNNNPNNNNNNHINSNSNNVNNSNTNNNNNCNGSSNNNSNINNHKKPNNKHKNKNKNKNRNKRNNHNGNNNTNNNSNNSQSQCHNSNDITNNINANNNINNNIDVENTDSDNNAIDGLEFFDAPESVVN